MIWRTLFCVEDGDIYFCGEHPRQTKITMSVERCIDFYTEKPDLAFHWNGKWEEATKVTWHVVEVDDGKS